MVSNSCIADNTKNFISLCKTTENTFTPTSYWYVWATSGTWQLNENWFNPSDYDPSISRWLYSFPGANETEKADNWQSGVYYR